MIMFHFRAVQCTDFKHQLPWNTSCTMLGGLGVLTDGVLLYYLLSKMLKCCAASCCNKMPKKKCRFYVTVDKLDLTLLQFNATLDITLKMG